MNFFLYGIVFSGVGGGGKVDLHENNMFGAGFGAGGSAQGKTHWGILSIWGAGQCQLLWLGQGKGMIKLGLQKTKVQHSAVFAPLCHQFHSLLSSAFSQPVSFVTAFSTCTAIFCCCCLSICVPFLFVCNPFHVLRPIFGCQFHLLMLSEFALPL